MIWVVLFVLKCAKIENNLTPTLALVVLFVTKQLPNLLLSLSIQVRTGIIYLEKPETIFLLGNGWVIKTIHAKTFFES